MSVAYLFLLINNGTATLYAVKVFNVSATTNAVMEHKIKTVENWFFCFSKRIWFSGILQKEYTTVCVTVYI